MLCHRFRESINDVITVENNGALDTTWSMTVLMWFFNEHGHTAPLIQYDLDKEGQWGPDLYYNNGGGLQVSSILHIVNCLKRKGFYLANFLLSKLL